MNHLNETVFALCAAVFVLSSPVAQAQAIEEIIVTAQKREESLQDVPISVNALTGDEFSKFGVSRSDDLLKVFPNLSVKPGSSINSGFSIRGVGTDNFHSTAQQAVGQYMDEVSLVAPFAGQFALFDLERVEVLRGPQNTLYGRNTTGGAVNMISRKPQVGEDLHGFALVNIGNEGRSDFEGAIGFPLGETAAGRLAVQTLNRDGVFDNVITGEKVGEIRRHSGRLQLAWEPNDRLGMLFNVHAGYSRGARQPFKNIGNFAADGISPCPLLGSGADMFDGPTTCVAPDAAGNLVNVSTNSWNDVFDGANTIGDATLEGAFVRIDYEFEHFTFTSLTSFDSAEAQYMENTGGTATAGFFPAQDSEYGVFSQELRLASGTDGSLRWITGAFYSFEDDTLGLMIRNGIPGTPPFTVIPSTEVNQEVEILSAYGKLEFDITDRLTFTGGLRVTDDQKDGSSIARVVAGTANGAPGPRLPDDFFTTLDRIRELTADAAANGIGCPGALPCQSPPLVVSQSVTELTGELGLNYHFSDGVMGFFNFSRGFKSGAFDTRALAVFNGSGNVPVKPEFLNSIEGGIKSSIFDGAMQFNASVFLYDWEDLQIFASDANNIPTFLNIPETEIRGAEAEIKWIPAEGWYVQGGLGLLDTEVKDIGTLQGPVQGSPLNGAPELTFNGLIGKDFYIDDGSIFSLHTDFRYVDEFSGDLTDGPTTQVGDAFFVNARASYSFGEDSRYELAVWGENLTEEKTCYSLAEFGGLTETHGCLQSPGIAFYGVSVQINFD